MTAGASDIGMTEHDGALRQNFGGETCLYRHRPHAPVFGGMAAEQPPMASADGWLRGVVDRTIAASSLVSTAPVLDMREFGWTAVLRDRWRAIRDEAMQVAPPPQEVTRSVGLWDQGDRVVETLARCPATAAAIADIPGLDDARFAILAPGAHVPARRGMTKGLVTCHLGLVVPRDGDGRMRVGDRYVRWAEGETLVFDDACEHESWNDAPAMRMVLQVRFRRPLRQPGRWIADMVLRAAGR